MSQVKKTGPQFDQGEGGAGSTKGNGSHREVAGDVKRRGPTGDPKSPLNPAQRPTTVGPSVPKGPQTAVRGGGGIDGHSRDPVAKRSGSKNEQNPNVLK
jgi:hypothetical protein